VYSRKSSQDITMVTTIGTGPEDVACAADVYERALAMGLDTAMPGWPEPGAGRGSSLTRTAVEPAQPTLINARGPDWKHVR